MSRKIFMLLGACLFFPVLAFAQKLTSTASPTPAPITRVMVIPATVTIPVGVVIQLMGMTTPAGGVATWTTSNDKVAVLDQGAPVSATFVRGVAVGTATITATINGHSSSCVVTVILPTPTPAK